VPEGALVVVNDTRVRHARIEASKPSGGRVELLFLERLERSGSTERWSALGSANRPLRPGTELSSGDRHFTVESRGSQGDLVLVVHSADDLEAFFERHGHVPLPPYIRRPDERRDGERYQTVFARQLGSAAAPTAGLHLTSELLRSLRARGNDVGRVTLHVGAGTFLPVRAPDLDQHVMHSERFRVSRELCEQVACARRAGRPVVAVGTTVVRALESARDPDRAGHVVPVSGQTRLLIQPGYRFGVVDALLTNFHAPRSTLLALVAAFIGPDRWRQAYRVALAEGYRFLSYGDAMWLSVRDDGVGRDPDRGGEGE
jgi:S-adenosylmethionine:tRNA ribosyltransferase-isomerase